MRISVALCTYNGEDFIEEQLKSIFLQTIIPDEVIICDDGSKDRTIEIINSWSESQKIEIHQNIFQLGTTKNFEKAISLCTGDIVFLADQDDVWMPTKVEKTIEYFQKNLEKEVVFTDATLIDQSGNSLNRYLWEEVRFRDVEKVKWNQGNEIDVLIQGNRVTGCTVSFKKKYVTNLMTFPDDLQKMNFIHDTWIAWAAASQHKIGYIDQKLVAYRQHQNQQIGAIAKVTVKKVRFLERIFKKNRAKKSIYLKQSYYFSTILKMFDRFGMSDKASISKIERAKNHFNARGKMSGNLIKKIASVFSEAIKGNYHHFVDADAKWYNPWLAIIGDIIE